MTRAPTTAWTRALLGLLGCLALAVALAVVTPDPSTDARRRWTDGVVAQWVTTPDVSVRVGSVQVVRSADPGYGEELTSAQALVVTPVEVAVRHRVVQLSHVYLRTADGHEYAPRSEFVSAGLTSTQPGFTRHGTLVFEVPPDRLAHAELVVDSDGGSLDVYADAVRVDLGLRDPVRVSPQTVTPEEATVTTS